MSMEIIDPDMGRYKTSVDTPNEGYGFITKLVIKISGGRLSTHKDVSRMLLMVSAVFLIGALYISFFSDNVETPEEQVGIQSHNSR